MKVLVPITISDAMLSSSTIAEPDASETAWAGSTAYVVGDVRIRTQTHRKYRCAIDHTSDGAKPPESLPTHWVDIGPTNAWAMFDGLVSTPSTDSTTLTVVLEPGFFNAIALFGCDGEDITVTVKDEPAGATIYTYSGPLIEDVGDWYEYYFSPIQPKRKLILENITPYSAAELTITITGPADVSLGMLLVGDMRTIAEAYGAINGPSAELVDYSYNDTNEYGETRIVRRGNATDLRAQILLTREEAPYAAATCRDLLSVPAAWITSDEASFQELTVPGLGSASFTYESQFVTMNLYVKGSI